MRLETSRLVIRGLEAHDADPWIALVNDPEVGRFTPPSPPATLETFHGALARRQTMERERGYAMWAVDDKGKDSFIGQCGLYPAEGKGPEVELVPLLSCRVRCLQVGASERRLQHEQGAPSYPNGGFHRRLLRAVSRPVP